MYSIFMLVNGTKSLITNNSPVDMEHKVVSPKLEMEVNTAGTLEMTVPAVNSLYDQITNTEAEYIVEQLGEEIWRGRLLDSKRDFWKNRIITCEGELAYLNDSMQEPATYENVTPEYYLGKLLAVHNKKMPLKKQFQLGRVTVTDDNSSDSITKRVNRGSYSTSYDDRTWDCITKLIASCGGHLEIRRQNGTRYLDYLKDYEHTTGQTFTFGVNLVDYTENWSLDDLATVIIPIGTTVTETDSEGNSVSSHVTVASVNNNSVYVSSAAAVATYGRREATVHFDNILEPSNLLKLAQKYLSNIQFDNMRLEIQAIDLAFLGVDIEALKFLYKARAISEPHGLDKEFPLTKVSIPLDNVEDAIYTMATTSKPVRTMSTTITDHDKETQDALSGLNDSLLGLQKQMTTYAADQAGTPDDWILGECYIFYPDDEIKVQYLAHNEYLENAYVANWDMYRVEGSKTFPGDEKATTNLTVGWKSAMAPKDEPYKNMINIDKINDEITASDWGGENGVRQADGMLYFPGGIYGSFPLSFERDSSDAWVVYVVAKLVGNTAGCFGRLSNLSDGLENSLVDGYKNTLRRIDGYTGLGSAVEVDGAAYYICDKKIVYALCYNVVEGENHTRSRLLLGDTSGVIEPDNPDLYNFNYGPSFGLNYYSNIDRTNEPKNRQSAYAFIGVCHSSYGQITMDEVWDNVEYLISEYINI